MSDSWAILSDLEAYGLGHNVEVAEGLLGVLAFLDNIIEAKTEEQILARMVRAQAYPREN